MPETLRDGTGSGSLAKVNANNRLYVNSVSTSEDKKATEDGDSYNLNTGAITLTNAADTPVFYLKNNETQDLHITAFAIGLGTSDGTATDEVRITVIRNPTAGTIINSPTNVDINSNRNFGSSNTLTADVYKGATGDTMTDGTDHLLIFSPDFTRAFITIDEILPTGASIGVKIRPPASNTSMDCYLAVICHLENVNQ